MAFDYGCGGTYGGDDGADEEEEPEDELAEDLVEEAVVPVSLLGLVREEGEPAVIPCSAHATSCDGDPEEGDDGRDEELGDDILCSACERGASMRGGERRTMPVQPRARKMQPERREPKQRRRAQPLPTDISHASRHTEKV